MSYSLKHDPDTNCIILTFTGSVTMDLIRIVAPLVAKMSEDTGCLRILNDMSSAIIEISFIDVFSSPSIMDESHVSKRTKRALVVPPDFRDARFLETVNRNRSHNLSVFYDSEEAKRWLLGDS